MVKFGLLVTLRIKPGMAAEAETFLNSALPLVREEPATTAWFAIRFGRLTYGIFDAFPDEAGREAHLSGAVAKALMEKADALFSEPPMIQKLEVLADKLPDGPLAEPNTKGLLLTFKGKKGNEAKVEQFLRDGQPLVMKEPGTRAWFAIHFDSADGGKYGIFDVFPGEGSRLKHMIGWVPIKLTLNAFSLLGGIPGLKLPAVLAEKLP